MNKRRAPWSSRNFQYAVVLDEFGNWNSSTRISQGPVGIFSPELLEKRTLEWFPGFCKKIPSILRAIVLIVLEFLLEILPDSYRHFPKISISLPRFFLENLPGLLNSNRCFSADSIDFFSENFARSSFCVLGKEFVLAFYPGFILRAPLECLSEFNPDIA